MFFHFSVVGACPVTTHWVMVIRSCENNNAAALIVTVHVLTYFCAVRLSPTRPFLLAVLGKRRL